MNATQSYKLRYVLQKCKIKQEDARRFLFVANPTEDIPIKVITGSSRWAVVDDAYDIINKVKNGKPIMY